MEIVCEGGDGNLNFACVLYAGDLNCVYIYKMYVCIYGKRFVLTRFLPLFYLRLNDGLSIFSNYVCIYWVHLCTEKGYSTTGLIFSSQTNKAKDCVRRNIFNWQIQNRIYFYIFANLILHSTISILFK